MTFWVVFGVGWLLGSLIVAWSFSRYARWIEESERFDWDLFDWDREEGW